MLQYEKKLWSKTGMKKHLSSLTLLLAAAIWGFAFVAQKAATKIPPFTLIAARCVIASVLLILIIVIFDGISGKRRLLSLRGTNKPRIDLNRHELIGGAVCGALLFLASALQQFGIRDTDAGKTAFITAMYVVIVPIYGVFLRKKAPINAWVGVCICVVGFYLLCINEGFTLAPSDLTVLLCAFAFAMQIVAADIFLPKCDSIRLSLVQFMTTALLSTIFALILEWPIAFPAMKECLPELLFLAIGSSGIAYTCQIIGQKTTPPTVASIILSLESVFGVLSSAIFLGERMSIREYIGCAVVFAAVIISQLDISAFFKKTSADKKSD